VGKSDPSNLDFESRPSFFDHWASVLGVVLLVSFIGGGLGILAGKKLEQAPGNSSAAVDLADPAESPSTQSGSTESEPLQSSIRSIFPRVPGCITTATEQIPVTLYLADTPELRQRGLQGVPGLPKNHGMLFMYDTVQPSESQFWMYQTPMNLDISYLDSKGQIQSIQQMQSCSLDAESCPKYKAGIPFKAAAEFPQGFYRSNSITVGDRISLSAFGACGKP